MAQILHKLAVCAALLAHNTMPVTQHKWWQTAKLWLEAVRASTGQSDALCSAGAVQVTNSSHTAPQSDLRYIRLFSFCQPVLFYVHHLTAYSNSSFAHQAVPA